MPWNNTTKKMVGAANINANGDIQKATGQSYRDIGNCIKYGCLGGIVNKFSLVKPIHYPGKHKLSLEDFRGTPTMISSGIVFGLEVPANYSSPNPSAIHATSWNYVGYPNASGMSGTSPYRFFDFIHPDTTPSEQTLVGYSQNARPDLSGTITDNEEFWIGESGGASSVSAYYGYNNTEGVRIAEFVVRTYDGEVIDENTLKDRLTLCYPCILIGNYLTALTHGSTDTALPLCRREGSQYVWTSDNWYVDMSKVLGKGTHANEFPWTSAQAATASLVLAYIKIGGTCLMAQDTGTDVARYWVQLTSGDPWDSSFFPLPGATGVSVQIKKRVTDTIANVTEITANGSSGFNVKYRFTNTYANPVSVRMEATAKLRGGGEYNAQPRSISHQSVVSGQDYGPVSYNWYSDFDIMSAPGQVYDVTVSIYTTINGRETRGESGEITITI